MTTDTMISGVRIRELPDGVNYLFPPQKAASSARNSIGSMKHIVVYAAIAAGLFFVSGGHFLDVAFIAKAGLVLVLALASMIGAAGRGRSLISVTIRPASLTVKQGSRVWGKPIRVAQSDLIDARISPANDGEDNWLFAIRRTTGNPLVLVRGPEAAIRNMAAAAGQILNLNVDCIISAMTSEPSTGAPGIPVAEVANLWDYPPPAPNKRLTVVATDRLLVMELKRVGRTAEWGAILVGVSAVPFIYSGGFKQHGGFYTWQFLPMLGLAAGIALIISHGFSSLMLVATPEEFSVKNRRWLFSRQRRWSAEEISYFTVQTVNGGSSKRTEMRLLAMTLRGGKTVNIFRTSQLTFHQVGYMATELRHFYHVNATPLSAIPTPPVILES